MKWSKEWIEHSPDFSPCIKKYGVLRAEPDCVCGIKERHIHCKGCGRVISIGDWDAKPMKTWKFNF